MTENDSKNQPANQSGNPGETPANQETQDAKAPETVVEPESALPEVRLSDLPEPLREACARAGWDELTPVQARAIPYMLRGRELMVQSRTGSGKTGAFVLPILDRIDPARAEVQALVLVPTRELANQVAADTMTLVGNEGVRVVPVYGGVGYGKQLEGLQAGAHIVVGTPGRILDHLLKKSMNLDNLRVLVFDEADRMLSVGFYPDMKDIQRYLPRRNVLTFLFSATYPSFVRRLAGEFMTEPEMLSLSSKRVSVAAIDHRYYEVPRMGRERSLIRIIEAENPTSAIIFCNTKADVHYVSEVLKQFGYDADELSADLSQAKRETILARIRAGNLRFLVATDVASRGIDISDLSHVFNYEPPEDPESYIHRTGRTGRAGASGVAITLVDIIQELELKRLAERFEFDVTRHELPADEDVETIVSERLVALLESRLRARTPLERERLKRFLPLAKELGSTEDQLRVLAMVLDEIYQNTLHAKPPLPEEQAAPARHQRPRPKVQPSPQGREGGGESQGPGQAQAKKRRRPRRRKKPDQGGQGGD